MYESARPYFYGTGRRKKSIARVRIYPGSGSITINGRDIDQYFGLETLKLIVNQPFGVTGTQGKFDIVATVVGGGITGQALVNYTSFEKRGFVITAVFDVNPRLIGMSIRGIEIYDVDTMEEYVKNNSVDVAILTLPRSQASKIATDLAEWGVKGIWNFSHVDLDLPKEVVVENVHLTDSLMTLLYKINEVNNESEA